MPKRNIERCSTHQEDYQELWPSVKMCESCYVAYTNCLASYGVRYVKAKSKHADSKTTDKKHDTPPSDLTKRKA